MTDSERVEAIRAQWEALPRTWSNVAARLETIESDILFLVARVDQAEAVVNVLRQQLEAARRDAARYRRALRDEELPQLGE